MNDAISEEAECWDENIIPVADATISGESNSKDFFSVAAKPETHTLCESHKPPKWHFPGGPGLAQEIQWPLWRFPVASYYPQMEVQMPFEVVWREWEEFEDNTPEAGPPLIPFPLEKFSVEFTVMSYNILSQDLLEINHNLYTHCPPEVLDWNYRSSLLFEEIGKWAADILCLQEVQENHYYDQLHPFLSQMGYTCVYKRRTSTKTDGCAVCYRSNRFFEEKATKLEFFRPETELLDRDNVGIVLLLHPVITHRGQVKKNVPALCVANTHLLFNPKRGDIKLGQLAIMLAEIDSVVKSCKATGEHCNVIFCGDFNSLPCTPLYQLITSGELYYQGLPGWMISGQEDLSYKQNHVRLEAPLWPNSLGISNNCSYTRARDVAEGLNEKSGKYEYSHGFILRLRFCPAACIYPEGLEMIPGVTDNTPDVSRKDKFNDERFNQTFGPIISHNLDLQSVYKHTLTGSRIPEVTTLHSQGAASVDYIFYSPRRNIVNNTTGKVRLLSDGLKLKGSLSLLSEDFLWSINGLPNHTFPSDHLSLVAHFQMDFIN